MTLLNLKCSPNIRIASSSATVLTLKAVFDLYKNSLISNGNAYYRKFQCSYIKPIASLRRYQRVRKFLKMPVNYLIDKLQNDLMKELVTVIIPILESQINPTEEKLLHHALNILSKYPIIFVAGENADLSVVREHAIDVDVIYFPERYFKSRQHLSRLLLMPDFYDRFNWCEFLLVHELNSWIIQDELFYWCKQGYDYLKCAPSVSRPPAS